MKKQAAVYVATFMLWKGQVLILRRRNTEKDFAGLWEIPGGRVQASERLFEACQRETFEETNIRVLSGEAVSVMEFWKDTAHFRVNCVQINFLCPLRRRARPPEVVLSSEHDGLQWVPWGSLGKGLVSPELRGSWRAAAYKMQLYSGE